MPLKKGTEQSVLSIVCNMLASKSANEMVKESIIDGVLSLLTLADEEVPDLVPGVGFVEVQEGLGKWIQKKKKIKKNKKILNCSRSCRPVVGNEIFVLF